MKAEAVSEVWKPPDGAGFHVLWCRDVRTWTALPRGACAIMVDAGDLATVAPALRAWPTRPKLLVRIGLDGSDTIEATLVGALGYGVDGFVANDLVGGTGLVGIGAKLAVAEAMAGIEDGATGLVLAFTGAPASLLACPTLPGASRRLRALLWQPPCPEAELSEGRRHGRALMLLAAEAAGVPAIDGSPQTGRDARLRFREARHQGFAGLLVSDPTEITALN